MAEFLFAEVLGTLPADVRQFLEDTSVLDDLDGSACRAVTGRTDGPELLQSLSAAGMLVSPDGDGESHRYHQLFRDLLQSRLRDRSPERFVAMHKIAAQVHEGRREFDRAAAHFTIAGDDPAAFAVLRDHAFDLFVSGGASAVDRLVSVLDLRHAMAEPARAAAVAVALSGAGVTEEAERWINRAESARPQLTPTEYGRVSAARALLCWLRGDAAGTDAALADIPVGADHADAVIDAAQALRVQSRLLLDDIPGARAAHRAANRPRQQLARSRRRVADLGTRLGRVRRGRPTRSRAPVGWLVEPGPTPRHTRTSNGRIRIPHPRSHLVRARPLRRR